MRSKTVIYLTYITIGFLLSRTLPFFQILNMSAFTFFCALFLPYFGKWKMLLINMLFLVEFYAESLPALQTTIFSILQHLRDLGVPIPISPTVILVGCALSFPFILLAWLSELMAFHKVLEKVGVYKRITL